MGEDSGGRIGEQVARLRSTASHANSRRHGGAPALGEDFISEAAAQYAKYQKTVSYKMIEYHEDAMEAWSLQTRRMTTDEVLNVLRANHANLVQNDEADDIEVSEDTRVVDLVCYWDDISWRTWPTSAHVLNGLFGIDAPLSEWKPVLTPQRKKTLQHVCEFVAERAVVAEIPTTTLLGKPCRTAGAFLTIRAMLEGRGVDTSELAPSTPLDRYTNVGMPGICMQLVRAAPSLMPRFEPTYRSEAGHLLLAGMFFFATVAAGVVAGAYSLALGIPLAVLTFGALLLVQRSSVAWTAKPYRVKVHGLRDFRDLSRALADEKADQPRVNRSLPLE